MQITHVRVRKLVSGERFSNRAVEVEALIEAGETPEQVRANLELWCGAALEDRSIEDLREEHANLQWQVPDLKATKTRLEGEAAQLREKIQKLQEEANMARDQARLPLRIVSTEPAAPPVQHAGRTLRFWGASDDLIEVEGGRKGEPDEIMGDFAAFKVANDQGGLIVSVFYSTIDAAPVYMPGCWTVGICPLGENVPFPNWPTRWTMGGRGYSTVLEIDAPDDVRVSQISDEGDRF